MFAAAVAVAVERQQVVGLVPAAVVGSLVAQRLEPVLVVVVATVELVGG